MTEKDKIEILKDILFTDDREFEEKIKRRIEIIEETVNDKTKLSTKVDPIIKEQLSEFTKNIPNTLGPVITETLKKEIENSKDQVVDALFPILGKMIKKYIAQELKIISDKINKRLSFKSKVKSTFGMSNEKDTILQELSEVKIEQVFLIDKNSGILTASYSETETIDEEMISGMLTAIKSFVEDAFGQKNQNLELIEYELYQIHLQSFSTHYIAVVLSGNYTIQSKDKVQDIIFNFYENFVKMKDDNEGEQQQINKELAQNFGNASI